MEEFTEVQFKELDNTIAKYLGREGAIIPVLQQAQELFGYLPKEIQKRIADELGMPVNEVYGIVTFYSFFTMVPRANIR